MQTLDTERLPLFMSINDAVAISGISRTEIYNRLKDGSIKGRKLRRHTLVETSSLLGLLDSLPAYNA